VRVGDYTPLQGAGHVGRERNRTGFCSRRTYAYGRPRRRGRTCGGCRTASGKPSRRALRIGMVSNSARVDACLRSAGAPCWAARRSTRVRWSCGLMPVGLCGPAGAGRAGARASSKIECLGGIIAMPGHRWRPYFHGRDPAMVPCPDPGDDGPGLMTWLGDEAPIRVLDRAMPGRDRTLYVALPLARQPWCRPARRLSCVAIVDRHPPFEMVLLRSDPFGPQGRSRPIVQLDVGSRRRPRRARTLVGRSRARTPRT